jgi:uncharacterized caspase-like protein
MRVVGYLAILIMLFSFKVLPAHADRRGALVIGNAKYAAMSKLNNPKNDALRIGAKLHDELHFETIVRTDLTRDGFNSALSEFVRLAVGADIAIIYYSGHGMEYEGTNYLLPVEANLDEGVNQFKLLPLAGR